MGVPELHSVVPAFTLPHVADSQPVSLLAYRQSRPVVLVLCGTGATALLNDLGRHYREYLDTGAEVLGVLTDGLAGELPPFPVATDRDGHVTTRLTAHTPAILLLDSFGELHAHLEGPWPEGAPHQDLLHHIIRLEMQCPECGAPAWADFGGLIQP